MLQPTGTPPAKKRRQRLLAAFDSLTDAAQDQLVDYAEFLAERHAEPAEENAHEPEEIPRPTEETVIAAVRRLSATYHMIEKSKMLHETSNLVSAHIVQGRPATEVIDELEQLFLERYRSYQATFDS